LLRGFDVLRAAAREAQSELPVANLLGRSINGDLLAVISAIEPR